MLQVSRVDGLVEAARARLDRLSPEAAYREMTEGAVLVDTRCGDDRRRTGGIPGSIAIPLSVLPWRVDPASDHADPRVSDPARRVILLCAHGYSSSLAAATMIDLGFERATDVVGGFEAWVEQGLPVERLEAQAERPRSSARVGLRKSARRDET
jgi:rhodanese-related sulfurtransferase